MGVWRPMYHFSCSSPNEQNMNGLPEWHGEVSWNHEMAQHFHQVEPASRSEIQDVL